MALLAPESATHATEAIELSDEAFGDLLDDEDLYDLELDDDDLLGLSYSFEVEGGKGDDYAGNIQIAVGGYSGNSSDDAIDEDGGKGELGGNEDESDDEEGGILLEPEEATPPRTSEAMGQAATKLSQVTQLPHASKIRYQIPSGFLKRTLATAFGRKSWSHSFYRGPHDEKVKVIYCTTRAESEAAAREFLDEEVLGFDMEWKPQYTPGIKTNASLIQLASEKTIGLFHIALHEGSTPDELMAPSLRRILESPGIIKTGVAILGADGRRLKQYFRLSPKGLFELSHLHNVVTFAQKGQPENASKKLVALAKLTKYWLGGLDMHKGKVRTSDWSQALNSEQKEYAAADAYAGYMLFRVMDEVRQTLSPVPPLPAFAEKKEALSRQADADTEKKHSRVEKRPDEYMDKITEGMDATTRTTFDALFAYHNNLAQAAQNAGGSVPASFRGRPTILAILAREMPADLAAIKQVQGVGEIMAKQHGEKWLSIIAAQPRPRPVFRVPAVPASVAPVEQPLQHLPVESSAIGSTATDSDTSSVPSRSFSHCNPASKKLLQALRSLRIRLASTLRIPLEDVATDPLLESLAAIQPRTPRDLEACMDPSLPNFLRACAKCGMGLLNFCDENLPALKSAASVPATRKMGRWSKSEKPVSARKSGETEREPLSEVENVPEIPIGPQPRVCGVDVVDLTEEDNSFENVVAILKGAAGSRRVTKDGDLILPAPVTGGVKRKF
jgi:ribonuclease D